MFRTTVERTQIKERLIELLRSVSIGDTISHSAIEKACGLRRDASRPLLLSAMKELNKQTGVVFSNVHDVGYQRLQAAELPGVGTQARKIIARKSRRTQRLLTNALAKQNIQNDTRIKINTELGVLGIIELSAAERSFARVSKGVEEQARAQVPSPADVAKALLSHL